MSGDTDWRSTKVDSKKYKKLAEIGCYGQLHNVIYGALNMQRGEVYAYPIKLSAQRQVFVAQDIICKYRLYLERCAKAFQYDADLHFILEQKP